MQGTRRLVVASAIAVVLTAAFVPGSGFGSSPAAVGGAQRAIPAGLVSAIHARLGAGAIRSSAATIATVNPNLGFSVALSADGTTALVGADGVAGYKGAAYIFHTSDAGSWSSRSVPTATLTHKSGGAEVFGWEVALSSDGTTAFVGAPEAGGGFPPPGAIYVFHVSAEDAWASSSTPKATLKAGQGLFLLGALALSQDGTTLVAGAPFSNNEAGGAYVFHVASEDAWVSSSTPTATLSYANESQNDAQVGFSVAVSEDGTTALVGDAVNESGGGAYVYHASAEDAWASSSTPNAILRDANDGTLGDALGNDVALSGDGTEALLGAPGVASGTGSVDVFHASSEAAWATTSTPTATLTRGGGAANSGFGDSVAVSNDGTTALVTAPGVSSKRGAAYIYRASGEAAWADSSAPAATLTNAGSHANDFMGFGDLSSDGATALLGAPGVQSGTGAADVFHVADESSWSSSSAPDAIVTVKSLAACVVPRLKGLKLPAVKYALAVGRCGLGKVAKVRTKTKKSRGRVLSQNHKAGKRLAIGAKVSVKIGK